MWTRTLTHKTAETVKGIYALIIRLDRDVNVKVGALGEIGFLKGLYVYVGSAQTNLEKRVERHLRKEKSLYWHIDYLLNMAAAKIEEVLWLEAAKSVECTLSQKVGTRGEAVKGFGCSDCNCTSHLFRVGDYKFLFREMKTLVLDP